MSWNDENPSERHGEDTPGALGSNNNTNRLGTHKLLTPLTVNHPINTFHTNTDRHNYEIISVNTPNHPKGTVVQNYVPSVTSIIYSLYQNKKIISYETYLKYLCKQLQVNKDLFMESYEEYCLNHISIDKFVEINNIPVTLSRTMTSDVENTELEDI